MSEHPPSATGIIVLGPYRSGTSVTSQVLAALGVDFGPKRDFWPTSLKNPGGFFERIDFNRANDLLVESAGQTMGYPGDPRELAVKADARAFDSADLSWRKPNHLWGVKDPRLCAALLTWIERGRLDRDHLRIVHVRRNLDATLRSSMSFEPIRNLCDGTETGVRKMLARYAELAQWHVDTLKLPTFAFDYERLVKEPETVVQEMADFLGVTNPAQIRHATRLIGKGKGMVKLQLERYLIRAPRRLYYLLAGRNKDGSPRVRKREPN